MTGTVEMIIEAGRQDGLWDQDNSDRYAYSVAAQALYRHGKELAEAIKDEGHKVARRSSKTWSSGARCRKALGR